MTDWRLSMDVFKLKGEAYCVIQTIVAHIQAINERKH